MLVAAIVASGFGTLWIDSKRTMIVPVTRLSPLAREVYRTSLKKREASLSSAVREHPEDWSLLCLGRAWRDGGASESVLVRVQQSQAQGAAQRLSSSSLGRRADALAQWWRIEVTGEKGVSGTTIVGLSEVRSVEEACLTLEAQSRYMGWLKSMRAFATGAIGKFGEHPALLTWRARSRYRAYVNAYVNGDPRARNPDGVPQDLPGAIADAKRAHQLAPNDPGIAIATGDILMRVRDASGPTIMRRYAAMNDPWSERRARIKRQYPAFF